MPKNVARAAFTITLEIAHSTDGHGEPVYTPYDVTETVINFAINQIPSAHCSIAVGRSAKSLLAAPIHETADQFAQNLPARIWLDPSGEWLPQEVDERWSLAGPAVIFDGYVAGLGYRRDLGVTAPVVYLTHWLSDLSFTSSLSDQSHPGNPAKFRWPAASRSGIQTTAPSEFITGRVGEDLFSVTNIQKDFWANTLHQLFARLSEDDILWRIGAGECQGLRKSNDDAQRALRRIERAVGATDEVGTSYKTGAKSPYYVPLSMKGGGVEALIARAIGRYCSRVKLQYYFNSTVWDKLIEFSAAFKFVIVPKVQTAMMVPFVPGLRGTFLKVIDGRDITHLETSMTAVRPLRAVGVLPGTMQTDVLDLNLRPAESLSRLGGCWSPGPQTRGMIMYVRPPIWLDGVMQDLHEPIKTVTPKAPQSATTPADPSAPSSAQSKQLTVTTLRSYFIDHAHYLYAQEMLRGRYAVLQGKLRFDIAPGTSVALRNAKRFFVDNDALSRDYVGSVTKVGIILNASAPIAATTFQLDYTRTDSENKDDRSSIAAHPLYNKPFVGSPLLHQYVFPD